MKKSWALEVSIVVFILAGALTYQMMHKRAAESETFNFVQDALPTLKEQTLGEKLDEESPPEQVVSEIPNKQELVKSYISGLEAEELRKYNPHISLLGESPDWAMLDRYQGCITREDFVRLLTTVYTVGESWREWVEIEGDHALIVQRAGDKGVPKYRLEFAEEPNPQVARFWRSADELGSAPEGKPLDKMVIAIDPGHIGGEWAVVEERDFAVNGDRPVREGEVTLLVAQMMKPQLEQLGAEVILVRNSLDSVNPRRPGHYDYDARVELEGRGQIPSAPAIEQLRNKMFYRVGEIRERAKIVNSIIRPDLTICLHFNATSWGDPDDRQLVEGTHFHMLLHGAFTSGELAKDDERFSMLKKIMMKNHDEEAAVSAAVAESFAMVSGLPAFKYDPLSMRARNINGNDYLWARNLLANRLFESPVIYMEPYVMNSTSDYARLQMGDYEGEREVDGEMRSSIFKEYTKGMLDGLVKYYSERRGVSTDSSSSGVSSGKSEVTE